MPRSELSLAEAWQRIAGGRQVVVLGPKRFAALGARMVSSLDELAEASCEAILWAQPEAVPVAGLRKKLGSNAVAGVLLDPPRSAIARALPWRAPPTPRAPLCSALLLAGLVDPRCVACADGAVLTTAFTSAKNHWLDAFARNS